jgi:hypothetical protein
MEASPYEPNKATKGGSWAQSKVDQARQTNDINAEDAADESYNEATRDHLRPRELDPEAGSALFRGAMREVGRQRRAAKSAPSYEQLRLF